MYTYLYIYVCICVYVHICICVYTYLSVHTHVHIYIYTDGEGGVIRTEPPLTRQIAPWSVWMPLRCAARFGGHLHTCDHGLHLCLFKILLVHVLQCRRYRERNSHSETAIYKNGPQSQESPTQELPSQFSGGPQGKAFCQSNYRAVHGEKHFANPFFAAHQTSNLPIHFLRSTKKAICQSIFCGPPKQQFDNPFFAVHQKQFANPFLCAVHQKTFCQTNF